MSDGPEPGYYGRPVLKEPVWIWAVPAYFVMGGAAGAAGALGAAAQTVGRGNFDDLVKTCRRIAAAGLAVGSALLIYDLGRPDRFFNMLRVFRPTSPLNLGSWLLASATPCAAISAVSDGTVGDLAGISAGVLGLPITGYTAVLLANTAVPVWQEMGAALPASFVASAATSAASLLEMTELSEEEATAVRLFAVASKCGESIAATIVEHRARAIPEVGRALDTPRAKALLSIARISVVAAAAMSLVSRKSIGRRRLAGVLGTIGAAAHKFGVFYAGEASAKDPQATFAQQRSGGRRR